MEQIAGWSAIVNGIASITSSLALVIFFSVGGIWGRISDGLSVIWGQTLLSGLILVGFIFGISVILGSLSFWLAGEQHVLSAAAFLVAAISGTIWSIWLGILLLSGRLVIA